MFCLPIAPAKLERRTSVRGEKATIATDMFIMITIARSGRNNRPRTVLPGLFLAALLAASCGEDTDSPREVAFPTTWTTEGPEVRIGSIDDPDYAFVGVSKLATGPGGQLYSLHSREALIRWWTPDGKPAGSFGSRGEGPGEFSRPSSMGFFGDTLWVADIGRLRISYFDAGGTFLGSGASGANLDLRDVNFTSPLVPLRDGSILQRTPAALWKIADGQVTETPVVRMDAEGNPLSVVWMNPHEPRDVRVIPHAMGAGFGYQPFGDHVLSTVSEHGLTALHRRAWTGEGDATVTVARIDFDGDTLFAGKVPYEPVPLPSERTDGHAHDRAQRAEPWEFEGSTRTAYERTIREATYAPEYVPPVVEMIVGQDGSVWLRRFDPVESETGETLNEWWVLDAGGTPVARALTPTGLRVMLIGSDAVWGVEYDEFDVSYIVRYGLVKG